MQNQTKCKKGDKVRITHGFHKDKVTEIVLTRETDCVVNGFEDYPFPLAYTYEEIELVVEPPCPTTNSPSS